MIGAAAFRISPQQERAWRDAQTVGASPIAALSVTIEGAVDADRLRATAEATAARHEILRTRLLVPPSLSVPVQVISDDVAVQVTAGDIAAGLAPPMADDDQASVPSVYLRLTEHGPGRCSLMIAVPARCADSAGLLRLADEVLAGLAGQPADASELQYADVAEWLNHMVEDKATIPGRHYWQRILDGSVRVPALPLARNGTTAAASPPAVALLEFSQEQVRLLTRVARDHDVTLGTLAFAAWQATLFRFTGQEHALAALVADGRHQELLRAVIGPIARLLPVPVRLTGEMSFADALRQLHRSVTEAANFQDYFDPRQWPDQAAVPQSFEFLDLGGQRSSGSLAYTPLLLHAPPPAGGLAASVQRRADGSAVALLRADPGRYASTDLRSLGDALQSVAAEAAAKPATPLALLPLMPPPIRGVSRPAAARPDGDQGSGPADVVDAIFAAAARYPDRVAVDDCSRAVTYGELGERARTLGARLDAIGVGPGSVVPVLVERGADAILAMLGVWQAGAAFVMVDVTMPDSRIDHVVADTGATVVITRRELADRLPVAATAVVIDEEPDQSALAAGGPPRRGAAAYLVYTSGSTGKPKGVVVGHAALAHYVDALRAALPMPSRPTSALVSTLAADLGYTSVFPALCAGGTVAVLPREVAADPVDLAEAFTRIGVDCLKIVPSQLMTLLAAADEPARLLPRRLLLLGGETCPSSLVNQVRALAPECTVVNHYGPSETTIGVCAFQVGTAQPDDRWLTVPIGRPLGATCLRVLDAGLNPTPDWVPGELYVAGPGVAQGYLGQPAATAERFLPDPEGTTPGARMYRTGDTVRRLPGGLIEFLGRTDDQVKVSGFRIELAEIEIVLRAHPGIRECVVAVHAGHDEQDRRLVAYIVPDAVGTDPEEWRDHAKAYLPEHMVPSAMVVMESLPRTLNGKVDRRALPAPDPGAALRRPDQAVPPRDAIELRLLQVWEDVLCTRGLGVTDNFFDVGGNSLLAVRLVSEVQRQFGRRLPISVVFSEGTVESMAQRIRCSGTESGGVLVPIQPGTRRPPLFCVHAGGGLVVGYRELVHGLATDQPIFGLESLGLDGTCPPLADLTDMAARYAAQIRAVDAVGPYAIAGWCMGGMLAYEVARQVEIQGGEVAVLLLIDSAAPDPAAFAGTENAADPHRGGLLDSGLAQRFAWHYQLTVDPGELAGRNEEDQVAALLAAMQAQQMVPPDAGPEQLKTLLRVYRANITALRDYVLRFTVPPPTRYPVVLFRAEDIRSLDEADDSLGWRKLAGHRFRLEWLPGDHHGIIRQPVATQLARLVEQELDHASSDLSESQP